DPVLLGGWSNSVVATEGRRVGLTIAVTNAIDSSLTNHPNERMPPPAYQWFRKANAGGDYEALPCQNSSNLVFESVGVGDAAEYQVEVSNMVASWRTNVVLIVGQPPTVDTGSSDYYLRPGGTLILTATAKALVFGSNSESVAAVKLTYQWFTNGVPVRNQTNS